METTWSPPDGLPPIWVDLKREPAWLDIPGTVKDLRRAGIELREGLILNVWDEDADDTDARDDLVARGEVFRDADTGRWALRVIGGYRHQSDSAEQEALSVLGGAEKGTCDRK